jgi:hypothetical protein
VARENCMMNSIMICTLHKTAWKTKERVNDKAFGRQTFRNTILKCALKKFTTTVQHGTLPISLVWTFQIYCTNIKLNCDFTVLVNGYNIYKF